MSKQISCRHDAPVLAGHYSNAIQEVYGLRIQPPKTLYGKFAKREVELVQAGVSLAEYAITIAKLWKSWVKSRGMKYLYPTIFLGPKSAEWYAKAYPVDLKTSDADASLILNSEILLANLCIRNGLSEQDVLADITMPEQWLAAANRNRRPTKQAVQMLCDLYGLDPITLDCRILGEQYAAKQR